MLCLHRGLSILRVSKISLFRLSAGGNDQKSGRARAEILKQATTKFSSLVTRSIINNPRAGGAHVKRLDKLVGKCELSP